MPVPTEAPRRDTLTHSSAYIAAANSTEITGGHGKCVNIG